MEIKKTPFANPLNDLASKLCGPTNIWKNRLVEEPVYANTVRQLELALERNNNKPNVDSASMCNRVMDNLLSHVDVSVDGVFITIPQSVAQMISSKNPFLLKNYSEEQKRYLLDLALEVAVEFCRKNYLDPSIEEAYFPLRHYSSDPAIISEEAGYRKLAEYYERFQHALRERANPSPPAQRK